MSSPVHSIGCTDPNCRLPVGRIVNGALVIQSNHHGEKHQGVISLETLLRLLEHYSLTDKSKTMLDSAPTASRRS